jgi:hypothetical protein
MAQVVESLGPEEGREGGRKEGKETMSVEGETPVRRNNWICSPPRPRGQHMVCLISWRL